MGILNFKRSIHDPVVSSNLFFLIPLITSAIQNYWIYILILLTLIFSSTIYHVNKESKFFILDFLSSIVLISFNFYSFYLSGYLTPNFLVAMLFVVISFVFYFKSHSSEYSRNHAVWHIASSVITLLAILSI